MYLSFNLSELYWGLKFLYKIVGAVDKHHYIQEIKLKCTFNSILSFVLGYYQVNVLISFILWSTVLVWIAFVRIVFAQGIYFTDDLCDRRSISKTSWRVLRVLFGRFRSLLLGYLCFEYNWLWFFVFYFGVLCIFTVRLGLIKQTLHAVITVVTVRFFSGFALLTRSFYNCCWFQNWFFLGIEKVVIILGIWTVWNFLFFQIHFFVLNFELSFLSKYFFFCLWLNKFLFNSIRRFHGRCRIGFFILVVCLCNFRWPCWLRKLILEWWHWHRHSSHWRSLIIWLTNVLAYFWYLRWVNASPAMLVWYSVNMFHFGIERRHIRVWWIRKLLEWEWWHVSRGTIYWLIWIEMWVLLHIVLMWIAHARGHKHAASLWSIVNIVLIPGFHQFLLVCYWTSLSAYVLKLAFP